MQDSTTLRTNTVGQRGTTLGSSGTMVFYTGTPPGIGNAVTGTLLVTLTAVTYASASGGQQTFTATSGIAGAGGTPGYGRQLTSGGAAHIEGTAGVGTAAVLGTVVLSSTTVASIPVSSGGSGYPASASLPIAIVTSNGVEPTIPAIAVATTNSSGVVTGVTITYAGSGYGAVPTASVAPPFDYTWASAPSLGSSCSLTGGTFTAGNA